MKSTTLIVLGGLLFAGTSLAAEPQQVQNTDNNLTADSGMKVGIDPKTGKLRRLTAAESANLDVLTAKNRKAAAAMAKGKVAAKEGVTTEIVNGRYITYLPESEMIEIHATIGADGKVTVSHDGQPLQGAVEAANE